MAREEDEGDKISKSVVALLQTRYLAESSSEPRVGFFFVKGGVTLCHERPHCVVTAPGTITDWLTRRPEGETPATGSPKNVDKDENSDGKAVDAELIAVPSVNGNQLVPDPEKRDTEGETTTLIAGERSSIGEGTSETSVSVEKGSCVMQMGVR